MHNMIGIKNIGEALIHGLKEHNEHVKVAEEYQDIHNDNGNNHKLFRSVEECLGVFEEKLHDLQLRIQECVECDFSRSFNGESLPEHNIDPHWSWWFKNKYPTEHELHYILFKWDESSNIVFTALRPSTSWIPDTADIFLANALKANGLVREIFKLEDNTFTFYEGVLITDLIKCRGKAREAVKSIPNNCLEFLKNELAIVRECSGKEPRIIAIGREAQKLLYKHRGEIGIEYRRIDEIPWIYLHNYAEWQGKANVRRSEVFQEYVKKIREAIAKAKPMRTNCEIFTPHFCGAESMREIFPSFTT